MSVPPCDVCNEPQLLPENDEVVALFSACQTQFRVDGSGLPIGFDYAGVEAVARLFETKLGAELFAKLQVLEGAWVTAVRDRTARATKK